MIGVVGYTLRLPRYILMVWHGVDCLVGVEVNAGAGQNSEVPPRREL